MVYRIGTTIAITTIIALSPAASGEPVPLDDFLAGFADNCKAGAEFAALKDSIASKVSFTDPDVFEVEAPATVRPAFAYPAASDAEPETGSVLVQIPLKNAQYKGLRVNTLGIRLTRNYRIIDDFLVFDETLEVIQERLKALLASVDASMISGFYEIEISDVFISRNGPPSFRCMIMDYN